MIVCVAMDHDQPSPAVAMTAAMLDLLAGRRVRKVMVITAHPDDEVVGAGAQLAHWPDVAVVHVTDGAPRDPRFAAWAGFDDPASYGAARRGEAVAALALAGLGADRVTGLGFDDQGLSRDLVGLTQALAAHIAAQQPDAVVTHPYEGGHPDHDSVCFAVHHAVTLVARPPALIEMTSYFGRGGGRVVGEFLDPAGVTVTVALDAAQRERKHAMYARHASQFGLLSQFPRDVERFRAAPAYDFGRKPCAGPVFYDDYELGTSSEEWLGLAAAAMAGIAGLAPVVPAGPPPADGRGPPVGRVDYGDLRRTSPIGTSFGYDRGTPIDRPYMEAFLDRHRADIRGRVLEVGDNAYTLRFGGDRVARSDVLHVNPDVPGVTIIGDLAHLPAVADDTFDCLILTQVLELVYDLQGAVAEIHRILRPGGVALVTVPGISNIDHGEWGALWMWSFTVSSLRRLLAERFAADRIAVESRGNVLAATAFLHGLAAEDLRTDELAPVDPQFQLTILARAVK